MIRPNHYSAGGRQPIDLIEGYALSFNLGNILKYLTRAGRKQADPTEDLKKALTYCAFEQEPNKKRASNLPAPGKLASELGLRDPNAVLAFFALLEASRGSEPALERLRCLLEQMLESTATTKP